MDEYAVDKLQFLKHLYDFDENDDINTFTAKLLVRTKAREDMQKPLIMLIGLLRYLRVSRTEELSRHRQEL